MVSMANQSLLDWRVLQMRSFQGPWPLEGLPKPKDGEDDKTLFQQLHSSDIEKSTLAMDKLLYRHHTFVWLFVKRGVLARNLPVGVEVDEIVDDIFIDFYITFSQKVEKYRQSKSKKTSLTTDNDAEWDFEWDGDCKLSTWLCGIARIKILEHFRLCTDLVIDDSNDVAVWLDLDDEFATNDDWIDKNLSEFSKKDLELLSQRFRKNLLSSSETTILMKKILKSAKLKNKNHERVLYLYLVEGVRDSTEIAEMLNKKQSSVRVWKKRGLAKLNQFLMTWFM